MVLKFLFFWIIIKPLAHLILGVNIRHSERIPKKGPAIIVANHNSHLDALILMAILPSRLLKKVRPVAAADYFYRTKFMRWFSKNMLSLIALKRKPLASTSHPLDPLSEALNEDAILILFPEGTRGEMEQMSRLKNGIAHLAKRHPRIPVIPFFMVGLGKSLPKGEGLLVPFFCDLYVGKELYWNGEREEFMAELKGQFDGLAQEVGKIQDI